MKSLELKPLKKLILKVKDFGCDLKIEKAEKTSIEYDLPEKVFLEHEHSSTENTITVSCEKTGLFSKIFSFNTFFSDNSYIKIYLGDEVEDLEISSVSGDVSMEKISLNEFVLITVSGDTVINDSEIKKAYFKSVSGDFMVKNCIMPKISVKLTSGDFRSSQSSFYIFKGKSVSGDFKIDSLEQNFELLELHLVSGDTKLKVEGNESINLQKKILGSVKCNIPIEYKSGKNRNIVIKSTSGDLYIQSVEAKKNISEEKFDEEKIKEKIKNTELLTEEEIKIIDLLKKGKISKEFALELLIECGYTEEEALKFLERREIE
jgi:DUF4097 and DUF4098 domain-containing protein YvlB